MTPELQQAIEECRKRGIVPGARVRCAFMRNDTGIVPSPENWILDGPQIQFMNNVGIDVMLRRDNGTEYATVITPAPAPQEEEGLKDGDACEPDENMRKAIVDRAKASGLTTLDGYHAPYPLTWYMGSLYYTSGGPRCETISKLISVGEFYDRLCVTAKKPKPIKIDGHEVKYEKGQIKVGCQTIPNATVRAIAEKLID